MSEGSSIRSFGQKLSRNLDLKTIITRLRPYPSLRNGQLDAEQLDNELLDLLSGRLWEGLKSFQVHIHQILLFYKQITVNKLNQSDMSSSGT